MCSKKNGSKNALAWIHIIQFGVDGDFKMSQENSARIDQSADRCHEDTLQTICGQRYVLACLSLHLSTKGEEFFFFFGNL